VERIVWAVEPHFAETKAEDCHPQAKRVLTVCASLRWAKNLPAGGGVHATNNAVDAFGPGFADGCIGNQSSFYRDDWTFEFHLEFKHYEPLCERHFKSSPLDT